MEIAGEAGPNPTVSAATVHEYSVNGERPETTVVVERAYTDIISPFPIAVMFKMYPRIIPFMCSVGGGFQ